MSEKNIQIKINNGVGYDILYPKTKASLVDGLDTLLVSKIDVVEGKGLSTNDYSTVEKEKLTGIEAGAEVNAVDSVAGKTGVVTLDKADVGLADVENKSSETIRSEITGVNVTTALGFTPENAANKGVANGYASLDANGKIAVAQLPDGNSATVHIVADSTARLALVDLKTTDRCFETVTGDTYIYDGTQWIVMADADWANVSLTWANIADKPTSTVVDIDDAVAKKHSHTNGTVLDKIVDTVNPGVSYDISTFITADHTHEAADIIESAEKQFVTATEKASWTAKANVTVGTVQPTTQVSGDVWFEEIV